MQSPVKESKRLAKRAKDSRGSENSLRAPSTVAYLALLAESYEFKSRCKALMFESQCFLMLARRGEKLCTKKANFEKLNCAAKITSTEVRGRTRSTVVEDRVIALQTELKTAQDAQKQSVDAAVISGKQASEAAAQLGDSVSRVAEVEENAKLAIEKVVDLEQQVP